MTDDVNDFLMSSGVPSAKFPTVGTTVRGRIVQPPEKQQQRDFDSGELLAWDDGSPRWQIKIVLATDLRDPEIPEDDGLRAIYIKGNMLQATRQELRRKQAKLEQGGELAVTYTADGEVKKRGMNPPKLYAVEYTPAAAAGVEDALADADREVGEPPKHAVLGQQAAAAQPAAGMPDLSQYTPEQIQAFLKAQQPTPTT